MRTIASLNMKKSLRFVLSGKSIVYFLHLDSAGHRMAVVVRNAGKINEEILT